MDEKKDNTQQTTHSGEQNPTLQQPGSQVTDYGNPTGGSANDSQSNKGRQQESPANTEGSNETIGNP